MAFYREQFPWATVFPKMHVMEDHPIAAEVPRWSWVDGRAGGGVNMKLERDYRGIRDPLDSLKYIVAEQELYTAPSLPDLRPPVKRRKLRKLRKLPDNLDDSSAEEEEGVDGNEEVKEVEEVTVTTPRPSMLVYSP